VKRDQFQFLICEELRSFLFRPHKLKAVSTANQWLSLDPSENWDNCRTTTWNSTETGNYRESQLKISLPAAEASGASKLFSSVPQSRPTLCDPIDCSTPDLPCPSPTPEACSTHVHQIGDVIQPSHPLLTLLLLTSILPSIRVFSNESLLLIRWLKYWSFCFSISSVQFTCSVVSNSLWPHEPQHARASCPSPTPRDHSNSCSLSQQCNPTISSSVIPFSSCPKSLPASGSSQKSQLFTSGGHSIGVSASISVLSMNTQDWSPLGWTGWNSLQSKELSTVFFNPQFKSINSLVLSSLNSPTLTFIRDYCKNHSFDYMDFVGKVMSLLFNRLSSLIIAFLPKRKQLLISWLQSSPAVILEHQKINSVTVSIVSPLICHKVMGTDAMIFVFSLLSFKPAFHSPLSLSSRGSFVLLRFLP